MEREQSKVKGMYAQLLLPSNKKRPGNANAQFSTLYSQ